MEGIKNNISEFIFDFLKSYVYGNEKYIVVFCVIAFLFSRIIVLRMLRRLFRESLKINESTSAELMYIKQKYLNYGKLAIPIRNTKVFINRALRENHSLYFSSNIIFKLGYLVALVSWIVCPKTFFVFFIFDKIFNVNEIKESMVNNISDYLDNTYYYKVPKAVADKKQNIKSTASDEEKILDNENANEASILENNDDNRRLKNRSVNNDKIILDVISEYIV